MRKDESNYSRSVTLPVTGRYGFRLHSALSHLLHSAPGETTL